MGGDPSNGRGDFKMEASITLYGLWSWYTVLF